MAQLQAGGETSDKATHLNALPSFDGPPLQEAEIQHIDVGAA
jgi:hypothetical protein